MSRGIRRILIPILVALAAFGVLWVMFQAPSRNSAPTASHSTSQPVASATQADSGAVQPRPEPAATLPAAATATAASTEGPALPLTGLRAVAPGGGPPADVSPAPLGSLDPTRGDYFQIDFSHRGAGIAQIPFSDIWEHAPAKRRADAYRKKVLASGGAFDPNQLDNSQRYILQKQQPYRWNGNAIDIPIFAAHSIVINGATVSLLEKSIWSETAPGRFETHIVDAQGLPLLEIVRQYSFGPPYDIIIRNELRNASDQPLSIKWQQYGPPDLRTDPSGYIDRRRFSFGFLPKPTSPVLYGDDDMDLERSEALKLHNKAGEASDLSRKKQLLTIWPNDTSRSYNYGLTWFASVNRYFGLAIHPVVDSQGVNRTLAGVVDEIRLVETPGNQNPDTLFTFLISPTTTIAPGTSASLDLAAYAGPLDRQVLTSQPYDQLSLAGMIVYRIAGGCCSFLTFQWLAHLLLGFLSLLHNYILFDWGLAIIALVIVVRAFLHPLTKRSQINMQRFSKTMSAMKPEIDKLQKKYAGDPKKVQQEQLRLMREHGANPLQMLGCLPMFLQTPIWIALWAMLYLAFELRQQPAFYGIFQVFGNWAFLSDLSGPDHFIVLPGGGIKIPLLNWLVDAINLLPLLMGVVFFIQQKYMSPPPTPNMTPEQIQQQRIMKVMMVVMMPLFLYKAPSGLTLYMATSSFIGILEGRYIRKHIDELDKRASQPGAAGKPPQKPGKIKDPRSRLLAEAIERAKAKRNQEPPKTFKKRK